MHFLEIFVNLINMFYLNNTISYLILPKILIYTYFKLFSRKSIKLISILKKKLLFPY